MCFFKPHQCYENQIKSIVNIKYIRFYELDLTTTVIRSWPDQTSLEKQRVYLFIEKLCFKVKWGFWRITKSKTTPTYTFGHHSRTNITLSRITGFLKISNIKKILKHSFRSFFNGLDNLWPTLEDITQDQGFDLQ